MFLVKYLLFVLPLTLLILAQSCSLDGTCYNQLEVPVKRFEMPDSVAKDSVAIIKVVYLVYNNCSKLNNVYKPSEGDTISVHIVADYNGCTCPDVLPDSVATIGFTPKAVRDYIFRAIKYDNTILQDTLKVYSNVGNNP
ncbi:MAG TPA: hypothetical protein DCQ26_02650 [Marinilabiliales bacterium]|nr:MAG: hypothetical protein A2W95_18590 [Bacteroidetes bacterium GWA2_40_14]OFX62242.1 MAG: hypothetical protein A2W84_12280 [Bacteroidetes bacterium GWC2_40_13]OFX73798.1 MAG: hypothetical protein A2W96_07975 [Bacteroidetes bacterium GWD2_40_43]OFX89426.1 MAG: hypothetical protein A2W97_13795 [Bacteroidetes bacterium GWE2_40_63]OFY23252.1 MAG: hypothetical protein A2W88_19455 [Bacteroidetes bacterium GWF2_40_13]OFZ28139.1 MAG: hypothetical protein A2437_04540 [Bacteroidetes bacterium RIFOXYC